MSIKAVRLSGGLALLALALAACASGDGPPRPGRGDRAGARLPNLFVSPAGKPYRAARGQPYPSAVWFAEADANHDGRLTRAEFLSDADAFFKELDVNHDGIVDGFEVQRYENEVAPEINPQIEGLRFGEGMDLSLGQEGSERRAPQIGRGEAEGGKAVAGDRRPEGAGVFGFLNEPEPVAACDLKFDSHITLEEWRAVNSRRFDALDVKHLGYLTLEGLGKTPVQTARERRNPTPSRLVPRRGPPI